MIKCAHCKNRHETVNQVRGCALGAQVVDIEKIEREMHAMVQRAEALEDQRVYAAKVARDTALLERIPVTEPGMYRRNGDVFQVIWNKSQTHLYANRYVPTYVGGKLHKFEFAYDKGAIFTLDAADRMTIAEVAELGKATHWCWVCHHKLTVQSSIERGIGPVCAKKV